MSVLIIRIYKFHSTLQRRRQRQRAARQVLQPLLAVPGWLPASPALSGHAGLRPSFPEVRGAAHRGLRRAHHAGLHRGRARKQQRAGARGGESTTRSGTAAPRVRAHTAERQPGWQQAQELIII